MIKFSKYHGCGNDFIIVNEEDVIKFGKNISWLAVNMCSRNTGIGADGLIVARRSPLEMIIINSDGSRATMCGNGIRCFANYCYDDDIVPLTVRDYNINTAAGNMEISVTSIDPFVAEVNMGMPDFSPSKVGCDCNSEDLINMSIDVSGEEIIVSSVFMGTVHTIVWLDEEPWSSDSDGSYTINEKIKWMGKQISEHPIFSGKTNVDFAYKINKSNIKLITYERGVGFTAACGTGACASVVMGALERKLNKNAKAILPYGEIDVRLQNDGVRMIGPAQRILQGKYYEKKIK